MWAVSCGYTIPLSATSQSANPPTANCRILQFIDLYFLSPNTPQLAAGNFIEEPLPYRPCF